MAESSAGRPANVFDPQIVDRNWRTQLELYNVYPSTGTLGVFAIAIEALRSEITSLKWLTNWHTNHRRVRASMSGAMNIVLQRTLCTV